MSRKHSRNGGIEKDNPTLAVELTDGNRYFIAALLDMAWQGGIKDERAGLEAHELRAKIPRPGSTQTPFQAAFVQALELRGDDDKTPDRTPSGRSSTEPVGSVENTEATGPPPTPIDSVD